MLINKSILKACCFTGMVYNDIYIELFNVVSYASVFFKLKCPP